MKILGKMQRRATIWILGTFKTSPSEGIEAIAGLINIKYHLQKLAGRSQIRSAALPANHLIRTFIQITPTTILAPILIPSTLSQTVRRPLQKVI